MERNELSKNIIIILLMIMIIGLAGLMCYDKFAVNKEPEKTKTTEKKEESKINDNTKDASEDKTTNMNYSVQKLDLGQQKEKSVLIDGKNIIIKREKIGNSDSDEYNFIINGKNSLVEGTRFGIEIEEIYIFGDIIVVPTYSGDVRGQRIYIFDKDGNKLKEIIQLDKAVNGMEKSSAEDDISFKNNKILIKGTRLNHGLVIVYGKKEISLCTNSELNDDFIVEATYEIEYFGNNKLSEIKMVEGSGKALKQAKVEYAKYCK